MTTSAGYLERTTCKGGIITRYGMPYKGSKNGIAAEIVGRLPAGEVFVDLFCGGCAITHAAILSGKWKRYIINDIDPALPKMFVDAINGKYKNETRWIDRETFFKEKENDPYIKYIWSFGNNGKDYLYSREIEPYKKALHYARVFNDFSLLHELGIETDDASRLGMLKIKEIVREKFDIGDENIMALDIMPKLERLQHLGGLERLEGLKELEHNKRLRRLQSFSLSYEQVEVPPGSIVYCDIPYKGTKCGSYEGFNHERFYKWAEQRDDVFISEYEMPAPFIEVASIQKSVLSSSQGDLGKANEKIYTTAATLERYPETPYLQVADGLEQMTLF